MGVGVREEAHLEEGGGEQQGQRHHQLILTGLQHLEIQTTYCYQSTPAHFPDTSQLPQSYIPGTSQSPPSELPLTF